MAFGLVSNEKLLLKRLQSSSKIIGVINILNIVLKNYIIGEEINKFRFSIQKFYLFDSSGFMLFF
jgi:hypothetical protein